MSAKLYYYSDETPMVIIAKPRGRYGFGTIGQANPPQAISDAWRMVQRAGLTRVANSATGRVVRTENGAGAYVEFDLRPDADLSQVSSRSVAL